MGGFSGGNPLVRIGATAIDAYTGVPVASTVLSANDARQRQKELASQAGAYDLQASALQNQLQRQVKQRQDLLGQAVSSQRARLSAMGIGGGGSSDALIAGLAEQAAGDIADLQTDYGDRQAALGWKRQQVAGQGASDIWSSALAPVVQAATRKRSATSDGDWSGLSLL